MSILINKDTKVITQGITGKTGAFHTRCQDYANGTNCFVAGVNPKKAGEAIRRSRIYASVKGRQPNRRHASVIYVRRRRRGRPSGKRSRPTSIPASASPRASRSATCSWCATR